MMSMMSGIMKKLVGCGMKSEEYYKKQLPRGGHVRVYVGKDVCCKFELDAHYLNHPLFENLLQLSVDEFGYSYPGALRIACEVPLFLYLVHLLKSSNPSAHYLHLPDLISNFQASHPSLHDHSLN